MSEPTSSPAENPQDVADGPARGGPRNAEPASPRGSITDSPWYWLHLFCVAALVGLVLVGPKFAERQAGVERKFQGRQRAALKQAGQDPTTPMSTPENRHVQLLPLYLLAGAGAIASWIALWMTRIRHRGRVAS